eukprot:TRINITY_DN36607_c0_g1_i1.p1 TRINITY_DN36607_c0_g1~~TRINITY_DN36607_c0_g1_i1.p1  ORF type:complete len:344 (+),score=58.96 TRINITY_DN36607_c0_g1_i1:57-1088(+)
MSKTVVRTALDELAKDGAFKRTASVFRRWIGEGKDFPAESGRYHLYVSYACPWASRCIAMRHLKGLEDAIGMSVVHPTFLRTRPDEDEHLGWTFVKESDCDTITNAVGKGKISTKGATGDLVHNYRDIRELYEKSGDVGGKYTVPVLYDTKTNQIVNNESSEIIEMFNFAFNQFAGKPEVNLFPSDKLEEIEKMNELIYNSVNNGVYRCGFAQAQEPYDIALEELFSTLDLLEEKLSTKRYLCGDIFTIADLRLFVTLVRFDHVYYVHFKTSKKLIREYPNLFAYTRDIYQTPGVTESVNLTHIVDHYLTSHVKLNPFGIVPPCTTDYTLPHDRASLSALKVR